ncbi:MAG: hypothetical protein L0387_21570 [Acidobacteria bacterium]|nr:hypothetical protein [Acidobacteriota bacterium]
MPAPLAQNVLCLDHYVEKAASDLHAALDLCRQGHPVDSHDLDWLLAGADFAVQTLTQNRIGCSPTQRAKVLELLLALSNLQEYLRHHSIRVKLVDG